MTYYCHICLKLDRIERRINWRYPNTMNPPINQGIRMSQKKLVKQLLKKLDKLESDREKLIDKLAKALDKLDKKVVTKKTPAKKAAVKKTPAKKALAKKAPTKKSPTKKAPAKKAAAKKTPVTTEATNTIDASK